ncbi:MAG TPA: thiol reductant ABC exporter subunit CydD [Acetobacteraceae bacterium]|jgi:ATP-binding cassette subfamily C protein CydD|nr:thiol reductant ABC exporter subunit CydD [Acetobacteraceae bacterium]
MTQTDDGKRAARAWTRQQTRLGARPARPVVGLGLVGIAFAIGQVWCMATVLATALGGHGVALPPLIGFGVLALLRAGLGYVAEHAAFQAGAVARRRLRSDALTRLLHAGPALLRTRHSGDLAAIVVDRVEALDGLFSRWVPAATLAVAGPILVALAALWADPLAALVLTLCGLLVPVAMALAGIGAAAASRGQFLALARLQARFLDRVRGVATIVLAGRAEDEAQALAVAAADLGKRTMRVLRVAFLSSAALDLATVAALALLAVHYGIALRVGTLAQPARALFALLLVPEFFAPLRGFAAAYQDRLHATGAAEALIELPPAPEPAPPPAKPVRTVAASGVTVAFEDVHLTWDPARGPALDGLSFRVPAGETLVLAGPSGAGKSTVIEILLGFARPDRGRVTLNGADITDLVPQSLNRLTAWIGQRPVLFAGSVRDNIRFARPEATDAEIAEAARVARVSEFADALPEKLDTRVGEGGYGLSGGQAQRVAIARAFLKNAPLLLLDEPTAHLDPATESDVLEGLRRLAIGRTVIMASHSVGSQALRGQRLDIRGGRAAAARGVA